MGQTYDFIANTADGAFAVDRTQTIVLWNDAATEILGFSSDEVRGRKCESVVAGRDLDGCAVCQRDCVVMKMARRLDRVPTRRIATRKKNGDPIWLDVTSIVVPSSRDELCVLVHLFRDATKQHELERAMHELAEVIARLDATRTETRESEPTNGVDLTAREREIMNELIKGAKTQLIADRLFISPRTVQNHVNRILAKIGVHSRLEAVTYAIRHHLV